MKDLKDFTGSITMITQLYAPSAIKEEFTVHGTWFSDYPTETGWYWIRVRETRKSNILWIENGLVGSYEFEPEDSRVSISSYAGCDFQGPLKPDGGVT